ncbi:hypothetical protein [Methanosarcina sp.]
MQLAGASKNADQLLTRSGSIISPASMKVIKGDKLAAGELSD